MLRNINELKKTKFKLQSGTAGFGDVVLWRLTSGAGGVGHLDEESAELAGLQGE